MSPKIADPPLAPSRRGRPRKGERAERERRLVEAALAELVERGYEGVTMLGVATRAGASKETLYDRFGNREGLFAALVVANADASVERVRQALDVEADPETVLVAWAEGLLSLLCGPTSVALNRAAMASPSLAELLLRHGRHRAGALVERYLARLAADGRLDVTDPAEAFELLYGLVVRDTQIRVLLGERPPSRAAIGRRARAAVGEFLALCGRSRGRRHRAAP